MTYHVAADFPDATNAAQLKAFIAANGGRVRSEFSRTRLEDLNDPRVTHGWRAKVEGVPVYAGVGGYIIANLPNGTRVLESESLTTGEGKTYIRHDGGRIPGLAGWSLVDNFDPPQIGDPPRASDPPETWPLETATNQAIINELTYAGLAGSIPRAISLEMQNPPTNRKASYVSLNSKLPLERWGLRPDRLERVKVVLRKAGLVG